MTHTHFQSLSVIPTEMRYTFDFYGVASQYEWKVTNKHTCSHPTLLEVMVLLRTRNGSIPRFIYWTPKWFYI